MGAQGGAHRAPWAPAWGPMGPLGPRGYIGKLPINRPNGGVLVYIRRPLGVVRRVRSVVQLLAPPVILPMGLDFDLLCVRGAGSSPAGRDSTVPSGTLVVTLGSFFLHLVAFLPSLVHGLTF